MQETTTLLAGFEWTGFAPVEKLQLISKNWHPLLNAFLIPKSSTYE